jgi:hypothetical protein
MNGIHDMGGMHGMGPILEGQKASAEDSIYIDLWEDYLEPA